MEALEQSILDFINNVYDFMGWPGVVVLMAIESACIPLPSEIIMPLSGWMLVEKAGHGPWFTVVAGLYGALGCTVGSAVAYWVGRWGGRPVVEKYGKYVLLGRKDLDRADRWFTDHGKVTVFVSRLLPVVRTFISFPAGIARMNFATFSVYTFVGSLPWCWALAYGGYLLGEHWERIREVMRPFDIPIIVAVLILVAWYIYHRIKNREAEETS